LVQNILKIRYLKIIFFAKFVKFWKSLGSFFNPKSTRTIKLQYGESALKSSTSTRVLKRDQTPITRSRSSNSHKEEHHFWKNQEDLAGINMLCYCNYKGLFYIDLRLNIFIFG